MNSVPVPRLSDEVVEEHAFPNEARLVLRKQEDYSVEVRTCLGKYRAIVEMTRSGFNQKRVTEFQKAKEGFEECKSRVLARLSVDESMEQETSRYSGWNAPFSVAQTLQIAEHYSRLERGFERFRDNPLDIGAANLFYSGMIRKNGLKRLLRSDPTASYFFKQVDQLAIVFWVNYGVF